MVVVVMVVENTFMPPGEEHVRPSATISAHFLPEGDRLGKLPAGQLVSRACACDCVAVLRLRGRWAGV